MEDPPHAIIVDLATGGRSDLEFAWRAHDDADVPLLFLWPGAPSDDVVELLHQGAEDVITESLSGDVVAARVSAVIRRTAARRRGARRKVSWGDTTVDLDSRGVCSPRGRWSLSRTEHALLLALLRAQGRTSNQQELIAAIWGGFSRGSAHNLRRCVKHLREKIEVHPSQPSLLVNVWGVGYRLLEPGSEARTGPELDVQTLNPRATRSRADTREIGA